jgi:hypothetical protein
LVTPAFGRKQCVDKIAAARALLDLLGDGEARLRCYLERCVAEWTSTAGGAEDA